LLILTLSHQLRKVHSPLHANIHIPGFDEDNTAV